LARGTLPAQAEIIKGNFYMQRVLVISSSKQPLMPCHTARARQLLKQGKALVYRRYPFTLMLKERMEGTVQLIEFKVDPGSRVTGMALVMEGKLEKKAIWAAHLKHRGIEITEALLSRLALRRSRRHRKTRYRMARFDNRLRPAGWLPPSLISRVENVVNWLKRLLSFAPIRKIAVETVRFDTQKLQNPDIDGVEYQQGTLFGYEVKEYLLEKWQRTCAYCNKKNIPLEIDHIHPKSKGGANCISNLTLACHACNIEKSHQDISEFLSHDKKRLEKILSDSRKPLKDVAAVNATRYAIRDKLKEFHLPVVLSSGGRTKFNRAQQGYAKDHFIDAICIGESGERVYISPSLKPLPIEACGRGNRQMCRVDQYGFPRTKAKSQKRIYGFKTGDIVSSVVTAGKKIGSYFGRLAVRTSGNFNIKTKGCVIQGISYKYCKPLHCADGYNYTYEGGVSSSP
jgi:5-methylcytosine-specific restriction endonuclease McrA